MTNKLKPMPKKNKAVDAVQFAETRPPKGSSAAAGAPKKRVFFAPEGQRRLTINVSHEMHRQLKVLAAEQDTTITDILTRLVEKELK